MEKVDRDQHVEYTVSDLTAIFLYAKYYTQKSSGTFDIYLVTIFCNLEKKIKLLPNSSSKHFELVPKITLTLEKELIL